MYKKKLGLRVFELLQQQLLLSYYTAVGYFQLLLSTAIFNTMQAASLTEINCNGKTTYCYQKTVSS